MKAKFPISIFQFQRSVNAYKNLNENKSPVDNSRGIEEEFLVDRISLSIPYIALSTKVNCVGEIEKRFFTPFGTIDVIFRNVLDMEKQKQHLEIEVGGDAEYWASYDSAVSEFRRALLHFVWGMITKDHLEKEVRMDLSKVSMYIKGSEIDLMGPCGNIVSDEWGGCNETRPV